MKKIVDSIFTGHLKTTALLMILISALVTVLFYNYVLDVSGKIYEEVISPGPDSLALNKPVVYIGVISRYPPNIIYRGYQPLLDYITSKTKYRFELKLSNDYTDAVKMLIKGEVTAAFLGSYVYVRANREFGVIPILKPLNENFKPYSRSVIFVRENSNIYGIKDLKGKRLALPSKESFSVNWLLKYELSLNKMNESDFGEIDYFPHHQSVIYEVLKGTSDVGVTREYLIKNPPDKGLRIIAYSDPIPTSPLVVVPGKSAEIVEAIKRALLEVNKNSSERSAITKNWDYEFVYGFEAAADSDYNFIRRFSGGKNE